MTKKQEKQILSLRKKGMAIKTIARETGVGEHSVSRFLKAAHETKADENDKTKGPTIGKYVKIADPKSVDGTDEVRIRLPKDADKKTRGCGKNCRCKLNDKLRKADDADKPQDPEDEDQEMRIRISVEVPGDILTEEEARKLDAAIGVARDFIHDIVCDLFADHDLFIDGDEDEQTADED